MSASNLDKLRNLGEEPSQPSASTASTYLFLSGADMDPSAVRSAHPGATFIARAKVDSRQGEVNPYFGPGVIPSGRGVVWGIVIQTPDAHASDRQRMATTDDGRELTVNLAGDRFAMGDPNAVLRAARYWELFPGYVALLDRVVHHLGIEKQQPAQS